ncbi:hypothetical protein [Specibacter sp. NPDC078709]|uniref:hypothetical protein n=1 Tax=Specibacter sp. NPDC078709 TaxID=3154364 RepID=UPI0034389691
MDSARWTASSTTKGERAQEIADSNAGFSRLPEDGGDLAVVLDMIVKGHPSYELSTIAGPPRWPTQT